MRLLLLVAVMSLIGSLVSGGAPADGEKLEGDPGSVVAGECGEPVSKPGGGAWECTFADNFDGSSLDRSKWLPQIYTHSGAP